MEVKKKMGAPIKYPWLRNLKKGESYFYATGEGYERPSRSFRGIGNKMIPPRRFSIKVDTNIHGCKGLTIRRIK